MSEALGTLSVDPLFVTRTRRRGLVLTIIGSVMVIVGLIWPVVEYRAYRTQTELWATGKLTIATKAEGRETVHWFIAHSYDLEVEFVADDGERHGGKLIPGMPKVRRATSRPSDWRS